MKGISTILAVVAALSVASCSVMVPSSGTNQPVSTSQGVTNPVITSFTANPTSLKAGDKLTLTIEAVSASGKTLTYTWASTGGLLSTTTGRLVYWTAPNTPGTYTVSVSVTDGAGGQAAASLNVVISANGDGSVGSPSISPSGSQNNGQVGTASWSKAFGIEGVTDFHFANSNLGWVAQADGKIRHTTDNGVTWQTQWPPQGTSNQQPLNTLYAAGDGQNAWAGGGNGLLLKTTDEGKHWRLVDWEGAGSSDIFAIRFRDLAEGLMLTRNDGLYRTTDGGENWSKVLTNPEVGMGACSTSRTASRSFPAGTTRLATSCIDSKTAFYLHG